MADHAPAEKNAAKTGEIRWKRWVLGIAIVVLLLFMALNSQQVNVNLIVGSAQMPLIFALLIAAALGALVGWAAPRLRAHRHDDHR
jgi:uncharacterized integral membrane protein